MNIIGDMMFHMGNVPVDGEFTTGNVFFLHNAKGRNTYSGKKPSIPFATLDMAMANCTADNGDIIYAMPGHSETITGAGGITFDVAGVSLIGLGRYSLRPTFLMDGGTTVTCLITAANCTMKNILFKAGHSDITVFGTITGKGFRCESCQWTDNLAGSENFIGIWNAGSSGNDYDGLQLINNVFDSRGDSATLTPFNLLQDSRDVRIIGNRFAGTFDSGAYACIYGVNSKHHFNIEIAYNQIWNAHTGNGAIAISVGSTTSTGTMHHNLSVASETSSSTPFVAAAAGLGQFENYYTGDDNSSGYLMPTIGAN